MIRCASHAVKCQQTTESTVTVCRVWDSLPESINPYLESRVGALEKQVLRRMSLLSEPGGGLCRVVASSAKVKQSILYISMHFMHFHIDL